MPSFPEATMDGWFSSEQNETWAPRIQFSNNPERPVIQVSQSEN